MKTKGRGILAAIVIGVVALILTPTQLPSAVGSSGNSSITSVLYLLLFDSDGLSPLPLANAGPDQSVGEKIEVTLDASGSTGPIASYAWTQTDTSGHVAMLSDVSVEKPTFTAPDVNARATLTFQLTVRDSDGLMDTDEVDIVVDPPPEQYSYDLAGRLTGVIYSDGSAINYSYDNNGNLLSRTVTQP